MAIATLEIEAIKRLDEKLPPLESGDRLTRSEFERRYAAMPHIKKAELIEGVVYVTHSVKFRSHGEPHAWMVAWLGMYNVATPALTVANNSTVRLDIDNELQPDALLRIDTQRGGRSHISLDDFVEGGPELIAEIAASSASYDLHDKQKVYRRAGIPEYVVWRILDDAIDWFDLQGETYVRLQPDANGIIRSRVFPGLWLAVEAMLKGDLAAVLAVLQQGVASAEHAAFVAKLTGAKAEES